MAKIHSLIHQFNGRCTYCERQVHIGTPKESWHATIDHDIPTARGGPNSAENRVLCCANCNGVKGDMTGDEFRHFMKMGKLPISYVEYLTARLVLRLKGRAPIVIHRAG